MGWLCRMSSLALASLMVLAMVHSSLAQNSPQDYLNAHNAARAAVGVGPIRWDNNLANYARNYANSRINDCNLVHSKGPYGENLAKGTPGLTGRDSVKMWVDEKKYYNYNSNSCIGGVCGHYTQVVWSRSVRVGCARVKCRNGWWFIICSYDPPGNVIGQRPYVLKLKTYVENI
ncbi:Basic form of pathogenesis-related protein like [Actinidia chinensis var. chinensis]|uniref:Basic form of pathogenesis-related protein like n=2 Tax=Actinidia TaxID=3624 RepID=A0A2R6Q654_ACTCC|nr:Basic form of pathogenesis-related protein like [Actinidia chinensis var. chinensis]